MKPPPVCYRPAAILVAAILLLVSCGSDEAGQPSPTTQAPTTASLSPTTSPTTGPGDSTPLDSTPLDSTPLDSTPLDSTPLEPAADWPDIELTFDEVAETNQPVDLTERAGTDDLYVAEKTGTVRLISVTRAGDGSATYETVEDPVLDLSREVSGASEQGLLGLAFSPDGSRLYVNFTDRDGNTSIEEFLMNGDAVDASSRRQVLAVDQPFSNHNGGGLKFGPDGFLYIGLGDGGSGGDPLGAGQDPSTFLGSMLRIDPLSTSGEPYAVPADNPFASSSGDEKREAWLFGLRNPWRYSFDRRTGDLWIGDVGQNAFEEIDVVPPDAAGANLGWNALEGFEIFDDGTPPDDHLPPIYAYGHRNNRCSVTGGFVYRGTDIAGFQGVYVFADFCSGEIFGLDRQDPVRVESLDVALPRNRLVSFGEDNLGELYVLDVAGRILKLVPNE